LFWLGVDIAEVIEGFSPSYSNRFKRLCQFLDDAKQVGLSTPVGANKKVEACGE
jgi:hypothetical protein